MVYEGAGGQDHEDMDKVMVAMEMISNNDEQNDVFFTAGELLLHCDHG